MSNFQIIFIIIISLLLNNSNSIQSENDYCHIDDKQCQKADNNEGLFANNKF